MTQFFNFPPNDSRLIRGLLAAVGILGSSALLWQFIIAPLLTPARLKVAVIIPSSEIGTQMRQAVELARDQHPLADRVELAFYETGQGRAEGAPLNLQHTQTIAADKRIVAVIGGPNSNYATTSIPILNKAGVAMVSPLATAPQLTKVGYQPGAPGIYYPTGERTFFRTIPSDEMQGRTAAYWAGDQGYTDVFITYVEEDTYSSGLAGIFQANMQEFGLTKVGEYAFSLQTDIETVSRNLVNAVRIAEPDLLYYPLLSGNRYDEGIITLFNTFPDLTILGGDGMTYETYVVDDPAQLTNLYATTMPVDPTMLESASDFVQSYTETYDQVPPSYTLTTYDATWAILEAIEAVSGPVNRASVLNSLHDLKDVEGALGTWSFEDSGDIDLLAIRVVRFDNGTWTTIQIIE